jgi:hypothetical protein
VPLSEPGVRLPFTSPQCDQPGNGLGTSGNYHFLAGSSFLNQLGKVRFGLMDSDYTHDRFLANSG